VIWTATISEPVDHRDGTSDFHYHGAKIVGSCHRMEVGLYEPDEEKNIM